MFGKLVSRESGSGGLSACLVCWPIKSSILRLTQQHIGFSGSEQSEEQSECEVQLVHFAQSPHLLHLSAQLSLVNFALRYLSCNLVARLHSIAQM